MFKTPVTSIVDKLLLRSMLRFGLLIINLAPDNVKTLDDDRVILAIVAFRIPVEDVKSLLLIFKLPSVTLLTKLSIVLTSAIDKAAGLLLPAMLLPNKVFAEILANLSKTNDFVVI